MRTLCSIWLCEKGVRDVEEVSGRSIGWVYSVTVSRIAVVISSLEVYGKQTFSIAFLLSFVISTARSMASRTSALTSSRWPSTRMLAPYRSNSSPCSAICVSLNFAISIRASTSNLDRLKFSMLKAYTVTTLTPDL